MLVVALGLEMLTTRRLPPWPLRNLVALLEVGLQRYPREHWSDITLDEYAPGAESSMSPLGAWQQWQRSWFVRVRSGSVRASEPA